MGLGISMSDFNNGIGYETELGYQKEIWKDRLRINPNLSYGRYDLESFTREKNSHYNSISFALKFNIDAIRYKSTSILLGCGGFIKNSRSLRENYYKLSPVLPHSNSSPQSKFSNHYYLGYTLSAGLRVNPSLKSMAINILPYNFYVGHSLDESNKYLFDFVPSIQFDFKF